MKLWFSILLLATLAANAATTILSDGGTTLYAGSATNSVRRGLVLDLDMDSIQWTSSTIATNLDKSGLGINGGIVNPTLTNTFIAGSIGQAIFLPLSNDRVECGSPSTLDNMTNGLTFSCWLRTPTFTGVGYLFGKGASGGRKILYLSNGYPLRSTFLVDCVTTDFTSVKNMLVNSNDLLHFAFTWDGTLVSNSCVWYINGMPQYPDTVTAGVGAIVDDAANNFAIGAAGTDGTYPGSLDQIKVFTNVLTHAEIIALYQEGKVLQADTDPLTNAVWTAGLFCDLNATTPGGFVSTALLTNVSSITNTVWGPWSFSASAAAYTNSWAIADIGQFNFINPITVGAVTYSNQTRAFSFNCNSGQYYGQWNMTLPTSPAGFSNFTTTAYFKSTRTYKTGQTGGHDIMDIGATSSQIVRQLLEDLTFWTKGHSVSNGTSIGGGKQPYFISGYWYQIILCWDTEHGLGHSWVRTCDDWPIATERRQIINYSISSLPSNTNASYAAIPDNTHGMFGAGTNYWAGFAAMPGLASAYIPGLKMRTNYNTGGVQ
jgi:hypothetical protein